MKIILTHDVTGLGTPGDIVEVKDGYGRNYLLPQGFAIPWSKGAERQISSIKRARSAREVRDLDHAKEIQDQLEGIKVILSARAGGNGRLFGSVTTADIAAAVKAAGGPALDKRKLETSSAIKSVGGYQVRVRLHPEVTASIQLSVVPAKA